MDSICDTPNTDERRTSVLTMRVPEYLKALIEQAARDDQRTLSSLLEKAVVEHLKRSGHLK